MKNNNKLLKITAFATILFMVAFAFYRYGCINTNRIIDNDTVIMVQRDTVVDTFEIKHTEYLPKTITIIRKDTITKDTILTFEHKHYQDTLDLGRNKAVLDVFVSGVDATLDSTKMSAQIENIKEIETIEITKYIERKKTWKDRITIGPSIGMGYGLINNKPDVFVGVTLSYKLWK